MKSKTIGIMIMAMAATCATNLFDSSLQSPFGSDANAVIGRPLTPVSYAGVARRSVRRTAVAGAAVATTAVAATALTIGALPSGCVNTLYGSMTYHNCSGTYYQQAYDGPNVVYVQVQNPPG